MTVATGIKKITSYKAQSGLGVAASGAGGTSLRRITSVAKQVRQTYTNNEIVSHQQSTGVNLGTASTDWAYDGLLSPGNYSPLIAALLRKTFTATSAISGASLTIAGAGPYTLTDGANTFLTKGVKIGDVIRVTAGAVNAGTLNNNILVTGCTETVITGVTLNGSTLTAEGPIAACTVTVVGKKSLVPLTGHTDTLFTIEEWYPDITVSETFPDIRIGQMDVNLPASGNAGIKFASMGLGARTIGASQVLTSPTAANSQPVLTSVRGLLFVNGASYITVTGLSISVKPNLVAEGPVIGSNVSPDMSRGRIEVSGQFTALFDSTTLSTMYANETLTSLVAVMSSDTTKNSDFVSFSLSAIKLTGDAPDDGEKAIIRTYPFTAQINAAGGAALANDNTIITVQDSQAA